MNNGGLSFDKTGGFSVIPFSVLTNLPVNGFYYKYKQHYRRELQRMKKILIVDDDEEIRNLLRDFFVEKNGYEVILAVDGEEAAALLENVKPDIVLLDIMLPKISGVALIRFLRHEESTKDVPIIFMSGQFTSDEFRLDGIEMGAADYVSKPLNLNDLNKKIDDLLSSK